MPILVGSSYANGIPRFLLYLPWDRLLKLFKKMPHSPDVRLGDKGFEKVSALYLPPPHPNTWCKVPKYWEMGCTRFG